MTKDNSKKFIEEIKDLSIETIYDKNNVIIEYFKTNKFILLKYGSKFTGRFIIADLKYNKYNNRDV